MLLLDATSLGSPKPRRRGGITLVLLLFLGIFLVALALVVESASLWTSRQELNVAADAAALAAVQALANDILLTGRPEAMPTVVEQARLAAQHVGRLNVAAGLPHEFNLNAENDPAGDIVVGFIDDPASRSFSPASVAEQCDPLVNAVLIRAERSRGRGTPVTLYFGRLNGKLGADVRAEALGYLDRDVIGFRPQDGVPAPLMPFAIFSDPTMQQPASWEAQTAGPNVDRAHAGQDRFAYDPNAKRFREVGVDADQGNGICEMTVRLPLSGASFDDVPDADEPNGTLLTLGQPGTRSRQIRQGVVRDDLLEFGGELVLAWDDRLFVPGEIFGPQSSDPELKNLLAAVEQLAKRPEPRIWPLYQAMQPAGTNVPPTVVVTGFVAARLARVRLSDAPYPNLELILEPCALITNTAVTDASRRRTDGLGPTPNRYIAKARLLK